jgi:hypothetical protein
MVRMSLGMAGESAAGSLHCVKQSSGWQILRAGAISADALELELCESAAFEVDIEAEIAGRLEVRAHGNRARTQAHA